MKLAGFAAFAVVAAMLFAAPTRGQDADGVLVQTQPERTPEQIEEIVKEMPPLDYLPPPDRWRRLPKLSRIIGTGHPECRIVLLGDSIINDTSRSLFEAPLQEIYPKIHMTKIAVVRGGTGCWWYKEMGRVAKYVLPQKPDVLIIGGISHHDDTDSIREVIKQVRAGSHCDIILMTGAFGTADPRNETSWRAMLHPASTDYAARLKTLADRENCAFLDMGVAWGEYIRASGKDLTWFKRDSIHANARGEQVLGRILAAYLGPAH